MAGAPPALKLLNANARVIALYAACLAGDPMPFWWSLGPLTVVTATGLDWHRRIEARLAADQCVPRSSCRT